MSWVFALLLVVCSTANAQLIGQTIDRATDTTIVMEAPPVAGLMPIVVIHPEIRQYLALLWDERHADQNERGYCVAYVGHTLPDGRMGYVVNGIIPAHTDHPSPIAVNIGCPPVPDIAVLHVHTPTTCERAANGTLTGKCELGGWEAYHCQPSPTDVASVVANKHPFALIQCDRNAIIPYFPPESK